jgi:hypothetical protein
MVLISNKISLFMFILLISCNQQNNAGRQSILFKSYIKDNFKINLGNEELTFIIFPSNACVGCNKYVLNYFKNKTNRKSNYLIVTDRAIKQFKCLMEIDNSVLIDTNNSIEYLDLGTSGTSLIIWNKNEIEGILALTPENTDSLLKYFNILDD